MKKCIYIMVISMIFCLCACGTIAKDNSADIPNDVNSGNSLENNITDTNSSNNNVQNKEIIYEITTNSDYNKLATDFNELIQDADLILKISVENVRAFVGDNGMIQTEITPKVQKVYKGSYDNQKLYVNGGEMLYDEFCKNEIIQKALSGHENPNGNDELYGKYVRQSVDNQYIFNVGEEYMFFAEKREDTKKYYSLYAYQGTYKIVNGMIENTALDSEEALKIDLIQIFNDTTENKNTQVFSSNGESNSEKITTEEIFTKKINDLK